MNSLIYMQTGKDLETVLQKIISIACDRTRMDIYNLDKKSFVFTSLNKHHGKILTYIWL